MTLESLIEKLGPIPYNNAMVNVTLRCINLKQLELEDGVVWLIKSLVEQNDALVKELVHYHMGTPQTAEGISKAVERIKESLKKKGQS